jgi:hypothetical protein
MLHESILIHLPIIMFFFKKKNQWCMYTTVDQYSRVRVRAGWSIGQDPEAKPPDCGYTTPSSENEMVIQFCVGFEPSTLSLMVLALHSLLCRRRWYNSQRYHHQRINYLPLSIQCRLQILSIFHTSSYSPISESSTGLYVYYSSSPVSPFLYYDSSRLSYYVIHLFSSIHLS